MNGDVTDVGREIMWDESRRKTIHFISILISFYFIFDFICNFTFILIYLSILLLSLIGMYRLLAKSEEVLPKNFVSILLRRIKVFYWHFTL